MKQCPDCGEGKTTESIERVLERYGPDIRCSCGASFDRYEPLQVQPPSKKKEVGFGGKQQGGAHYGDPKTDPFAFGCANDLDPVSFSIVKYGMRIGKKGERDQWILDARKAIQCTERRCLDLGISLEELYE